jgi:hypothetical protein
MANVLSQGDIALSQDPPGEAPFKAVSELATASEREKHSKFDDYLPMTGIMITAMGVQCADVDLPGSAFLFWCDLRV